MQKSAPVKAYSGLQIMRKVVPYLWPKGQLWVKRRVVLAMAALLVAKLATVATPLFFMAAVDALAPDGHGPVRRDDLDGSEHP